MNNVRAKRFMIARDDDVSMLIIKGQDKMNRGG
jgi:hypothetical protein